MSKTNSDAPALPSVVNTPVASVSQGLGTVVPERFPYDLPRALSIFLGQDGSAYSVRADAGNHYVLRVGCRRLNNIIRAAGRIEGVTLRKTDISEINNYLQAHAETAGINKAVWYRVAPIPGGVELDLGDEKHTHVRITPGTVEVVTERSQSLFYRTQVSQSFVIPAASGNLDLLNRYLNLHPTSVVLLIGWLTYTLAHPKILTTKYLILVLQGGQGSGKTMLCNFIRKLIDPSLVKVGVLPSNGRDFAIAAQNAHVLCYDNVRGVKPAMADLFCIAATGGAFSTRKLYTDAEEQIHHLQVALILNGLHPFIDQADLAQRCLPMELRALPESNRQSEAQLVREFDADSPAILRGLLELIAAILQHLPSAEVTDPERMIDFVRWLAAMEKAQGIPPGIFQAAYSNALNEGQRDSLSENLLAAAVIEFAEDQVVDTWSGTPSDLLAKLNARALRGTQRSREWPQNPISISKKMIPLQAGLRTQGIRVELSRGKHRMITITKTGGKHD